MQEQINDSRGLATLGAAQPFGWRRMSNSIRSGFLRVPRRLPRRPSAASTPTEPRFYAENRELQTIGVL